MTSDRIAFYERLLFEHVVAPWFPRCIDHRRGGFVQDFDVAWNPADDGSKFLEFQARQTLAAAELSMAYPALEVAADAARHGFAFLRDVMWDAEHGGWFVRVSPHERDAAGGAKHLHGMAYAIIACLAVHRAHGCPDALALARAAIDWVDRHAHDDDHGGYHALLRRDGTVVGAADADAPAVDHVGTPVGLKDFNVHGDLLEAFTYAAALLDDSAIAARRDELVAIVVRGLSGGDLLPCHCRDRQWRCVPTIARPPTILQNASRLLEVRKAPGAPRGIVAVVDDVIERVWRHAYDDALDSIPLDYRLDRPPTPTERAEVQWWGQLEALKVLEYRLAISPGVPDNAARRDRVLRSLLENFLDPVHGGFRFWSRWSIDDESVCTDLAERLRHASKANAWKDASHDTRTLLRLLELQRGADAISPLGGPRDRPVPAYHASAPGGASIEDTLHT